jgi:hypothetical protein
MQRNKINSCQEFLAIEVKLEKEITGTLQAIGGTSIEDIENFKYYLEL